MATPNEVLILQLGAKEYGVDILRIQEIRSLETRPPGKSTAPSLPTTSWALPCWKMPGLVDVEPLMTIYAMGLADAALP